ncbi:MAG: formate dehydrogenase accessory sulfurtransferase FdhD [Devosiaceae bacterium]
MSVQAIEHTARERGVVVRTVPQEAPVELRFNGTAYATMMVTPDDLVNFARGFTFSEAIATDPQAIKDIEVRPEAGGFIVDVQLHGSDYAALLREGQRLIPGRTGCGLCGVRTLDDARANLPQAPAGLALEGAALTRALDTMRCDYGMHGAAFCDAQGHIKLMWQDVGRHNALDKLIGALVGADTTDLADGFCLITSRCSYEMVLKAVRGGFSTLVAISSPTGLALDTAREAGLRVVALAGKKGHTVFVEPSLEQPDIAV